MPRCVALSLANGLILYDVSRLDEQGWRHCRCRSGRMICIVEQLPATITASDDMMICTCQLNSWRTRHGVSRLPVFLLQSSKPTLAEHRTQSLTPAKPVTPAKPAPHTDLKCPPDHRHSDLRNPLASTSVCANREGPDQKALTVLRIVSCVELERLEVAEFGKDLTHSSRIDVRGMPFVVINEFAGC